MDATDHRQDGTRHPGHLDRLAVTWGTGHRRDRRDGHQDTTAAGGCEPLDHQATGAAHLAAALWLRLAKLDGLAGAEPTGLDSDGLRTLRTVQGVSTG